jgi:hypothetical protein
MGKKKLPLVGMFILCIILARAGATGTPIGATMTVVPPPQNISAPGVSFTVNVTLSFPIAHKIDFYDIVSITWDPTKIQLQTGTDADIVEGSYMKAFGTTVFVDTGINNTKGIIGEISCGYSTASEANGNGTLLSIKFKSIAAGSSPIKIGYAVVLDTATNVSWYWDPTTTPKLQINNATAVVIPEFSASVLLPLFLVVTTIAIAAATVSSRKRRILPRIS